jgi:hypothetical protein
VTRSFVVCAVAILVGCGGAQHPTTPAPHHYPVLAHVPAASPYLLAARQLSASARLVRDLASLGGVGVTTLADLELTRRLGVSPIDPAALADAGFAPDGSLALYGAVDGGPTLLLPVAHAERVDALLAKHPDGPLGDGWTLTHASIGGFVALHLVPPGQAPEAWLRELRSTRDRFAAAIEDSDAVLVLDVPALDRILAPSAPAVCAGLRRDFAKRWGRVIGQARFASGELHASAVIELPPAPKQTLAAHLLPLEPVSEGRAVRATFRVDLAWLAERNDTSAVDASQCQGLLAAGQLLDPALLSALVPGVRAFDVGISGAIPRGDALDLDAQAALLVAPDAVPSLTARLGRAEELGLTRPVDVTATDRTVRVATRGKPLAAMATTELPLAGLHFTAGPIPDLVPLSRFVKTVLLGAGGEPGILVDVFGRIQTLDLTAALGAPGLTVSLDLVLRP